MALSNNFIPQTSLVFNVRDFVPQIENLQKGLKENEKKNPQSLLSLRKKKKKISERIDNIKRLTAFHEEETKNIIIN